jgi:hypothetical protein
VAPLNGPMINFVMMKITMQDAILMEALVATILPQIGIITVIHANVSTQQL